MANNTKERFEQLHAIAMKISARELVDPWNPPASNLPYIEEIRREGECHKETARRVWLRFLRRQREGADQQWGGARPGSGRKRKVMRSSSGQ